MASSAVSHVKTVSTPTARKRAGEPFWLGGAAASMAAFFTHPLDQTKYRMQAVSTRVSFLSTLRLFAARDGFLSLWSGYSASILRQSTYSTARFALYDYFSRNLPSSSPKSSVKTPSSTRTLVCAGLAGGIAGLIGNPAEIVLVRMCSDGAKLRQERFAYRNALSGLVRIGLQDGPAAYFRGLGPNIVRSVLMNCSQIATYTKTKELLLGMKSLGLEDNLKVHIMASLVAGTVATTACAPADVVKSRFQNAKGAPGVSPPSVVRYVLETARKEGPGFLMKGWMPAWLRLAPNTVLTFVFLEKLKAFMAVGSGKGML